MIKVCVRRRVSGVEARHQSRMFTQIEGKSLFTTDSRDWWVTDIALADIARGVAITFVFIDVLFEGLFERCRTEITPEGFYFSAKRKDCPEAFFGGIVESVSRS